VFNYSEYEVKVQSPRQSMYVAVKIKHKKEERDRKRHKAIYTSSSHNPRVV